MVKLAVSLDSVFRGWDTVASMRAIKELGIDAFEFWHWTDKDLPRMKQAKEELGLTLVTFLTKSLNMTDAKKRQEYIEGLRESLAVACYLGSQFLMTQSGPYLPGVPRELQYRSMVDGLKASVPYLEQAGIVLLVEPLNILTDHPGTFLYTSEEAFRMMEEVNSPYVKVLYDIYHQQVTEGNLIATILSNLDQIRHFQAAGNPGRHELYIGEINYREVFKAIDGAGFDGYVGLEYFPVEDPRLGIWRLLHGLWT
jgi:hydroxypyruvate isomerase